MSYSMTPQAGLGDVTCWGVDLDTWDQQNRVPLYADKTNTWVVKLSMGSGFMADSFSAVEAEQRLRAQMDKWFAWKGKSLGRVDILAVKVLDPKDPKATTTSAQPVLLASQTVNPPLGWEDGPVIFLEVSFVYRGAETSLPWPRYSGEFFGPFCPKATRFGVYAVYPAGEVAPEDPCKAPDAWLQNPNCNPLSNPSLLPWWVWVATAGVVVFYAYPVIAPIAGAVSARVGEAIRTKKKD